jgi:hypothetical protein
MSKKAFLRFHWRYPVPELVQRDVQEVPAAARRLEAALEQGAEDHRLHLAPVQLGRLVEKYVSSSAFRGSPA